MHYSVLVPVFNEDENVLPLADELFQTLTLAGAPFEVIFVDDGSTDGTAKRLAAALPRYPGLRLVQLGQRCGKSAALVAGARAAQHPWIVTLDGDGQNDPADVPRLLEAAAADEGLVLVAGMRTRRRDTLWRHVSSRVANGVRRSALRDDCPDTACGLKLIRRDVLLSLPFFDGVHRFFPALVRAHGHRYANLPVNDRRRRAGRSKYSTLGRAVAGLFDLMGVVWLLRRTHLAPAPVEVHAPTVPSPEA